MNFGLSPADYRAKWGLPHDYPLVAPNYAATRSGLAKTIGLGRKAAIKTGELETNEMKEPDVTLGGLGDREVKDCRSV